MEKKMSKALETVMAEYSVCEVFEVEYEDDHFTPCYLHTRTDEQPEFKTSTAYFVSTRYMLEDLYDAETSLSEMESIGYDLENIYDLRKAIFTAWCEELDVPEGYLVAEWYADSACDSEITICIADDPLAVVGSIAGEDIYTDGTYYWYPDMFGGYQKGYDFVLLDDTTEDGMPIYMMGDEYLTATKQGGIRTFDSLEELGF